MAQKRKFFGTDGIRGQANTGVMTAEVIIKLAMASASVFKKGNHRHTVVIGKDTRLSGYMIESALQAGFTSMGFDVILLGPIPTPAVALLTKSLRADLGVMISASHNPYPDNGIKFFGPDGYKLSDEIELSIENIMEKDITLPGHKTLGRAKRLDDATGRYIEFAKSTFPKNLRLDGLKIIVDSAHGGAYKAAPAILWELGATIISIGNHPNGLNINDKCGATSLDLARQKLLENHADLAVVLDGDADRLMMIDHEGNVLDGDKILALIATYLHDKKALQGDSIVATHMSNLGLERYIKSIGLNLIRTNVGDRYVIDAMRKHQCTIGGEQSGHIILHEYTTTGDGLIAALQVLAIMQEKNQPLAKLSHIYEAVPQVLHNIPLQNSVNLSEKKFESLIQKAREAIGLSGHLLVRASGTEPLLRIMAQGDNIDVLNEVIQNLVNDIEKVQAS